MVLNGCRWFKNASRKRRPRFSAQKHENKSTHLFGGLWTWLLLNHTKKHIEHLLFSPPFKASQQAVPFLQVPDSAKLFPNKTLSCNLVYRLYKIKNYWCLKSIHKMSTFFFHSNPKWGWVLHYGYTTQSRIFQGWPGWGPPGPQPGNHGQTDHGLFLPDHGLIMG